MLKRYSTLFLGCLLSTVLSGCTVNSATKSPSAFVEKEPLSQQTAMKTPISLGPRAYFLIDDMRDSPLKKRLQACKNIPMQSSKFSIGHRGAPLQFPEHTKESYVAAAIMGAGVIECDVTFTKDRELVCRHSQCDLHATTNILLTPLAKKCTVPPKFHPNGKLINAKNIQCCTSDITLNEFTSLTGKMDAANTDADTIEDYVNATPNWRTDLYSAKGTLLSHAQSITLLDQLGVDFTPELKRPFVDMPFQGEYSQTQYAAQMLDEYHQAGINPQRVWPQSFNYSDIRYWLAQHPEFSEQAILLEEKDHNPSFETLMLWHQQGVNYLAPPLWKLLSADKKGHIIASNYAQNANKAGLKLITWSLERSGILKNNSGWYFQSLNGELGGKNVIEREGDIMEVLDALVQKAGVVAVFSDWPAITTYYANCLLPK